MGRFQLLAATLVLAMSSALAQAGPPVRIGVGLNFGVPHYHHYPRAYGYPYWYHGYGYPYVVPAPIVYQTAPVIVHQPATVVTTPSYSAPSNTTPSTAAPSFSAPEPTPVSAASNQGNLEYQRSRLTNPDETIRREAVMELGRSKNERAVDPLTATLAGDRSPTVRDAAARALGIIGSPRSLTALINAAQADNDRDVRHSAQFAVEIIRSNLQRN